MSRKANLFLLLLTMILWGANFHIVKIALKYYSPESVASWRFFFGVLTLLIILYFQFGKKLFNYKISLKDYWFIFLTAFFGIFLTIYFFNKGLKTTSAINGALIASTGPAITAVFAFIFLKQRISFIQWLAIILSFLGVIVVLVKGHFSKLAQLEFESGDIYLIFMALCFSFSQIIVSKYLSHIQSTIMTTISSLMGLFLFLIFASAELTSTPLPLELDFWASVLYMGVLGTGIAFTAFYYSVVQLGPTISTLYLNLIPFFAVLLAFPFGERISWSQIIGGIIIVIGILLFTNNARRSQVITI